MSGTISSQSLSLSSTVNDMSINKPTDLPGSRPKRLVLEARARIRQWTDKTTIHGLPQIVFGKQIIFRLIWVLLFLAATAITIIMVTQSVVKYFEYEVVTVMQYEQETSIVFPQITICNINPFVTNESLEFMTEFLESNGIYDVSNSSVLAETYPSNTSQLFNNYFFGTILEQVKAASPNISDATRASFGLNYDQFFISCFFSLAECSRDDWFNYYDVKFGNCFKFNSGFLPNGTPRNRTRTVTQTGITAGLLLELFVPELDNQALFSRTNGVRFLINDMKGYVGALQGVMAPVGFNTHFALHKTVLTKLPAPYSQCIQNTKDAHGYGSELYQTMIAKNYTYNQADCFNIYVQKKVIERCKCYYPIFINYQDWPVACESMSQYNCSIKVVQETYRTDFRSSIVDICPLECESKIYSYSTSMSSFPTKNYAKNLLKQDNYLRAQFPDPDNVSLEEVRSKVLSLNIHFPTLTYTSIKEIPQCEFIDLVGQVGGQIGVFLGMSILSGFELVQIFVDLVILLAGSVFGTPAPINRSTNYKV